MNYGISILFRAIPLAMALFCVGYGAFVLYESENDARWVAGPVLLSLGMICVALFSTAATIIRQLIHTYNRTARFALPILGYAAAIFTFAAGWGYMADAATVEHFVAGHVVCSVSFIVVCISTTATASTRFTFIPINALKTGHVPPQGCFTRKQSALLIGIGLLMALIGWGWTFVLLSRVEAYPPCYIAGHVLLGLSCICTSLVALITTIVRQIGNVYREGIESKLWPLLVLLMGSISFLDGLYVVLTAPIASHAVIGYILMGLGMVCYSISSKVILLAVTWRRTFALANRIPLVPIFTAFFCLFLSAFLFEISETHDAYFVPARVLAGLGAICFTLFSIVSILESGTAKSSA